MSTEPPTTRHPRTRGAAVPSTASPQNRQDPHQHNAESYSQNSRGYPQDSHVSMYSSPQPTTPPRTPGRDNLHTSQNNKNNKNNNSNRNMNPSNTESSSKQKGRNKNRPKNVNISPAVHRNDRNSPPLASGGVLSSTRKVTTPITAAYAGPTFHASPAPSALPIPSFYSKSVPDSPGILALKSIKRDSMPAVPSSYEASKSPAPLSASQQKREESPLDFFFKADREEKARARSASSLQQNATGPFKPPISPRIDQNSPVGMNVTRQRHTAVNRSLSGGIFPFELDGPTTPGGTSGNSFGPAFSTPYQERINAARAASKPSIPEQSTQATSMVADSTDRSEQLKAYLFSGRKIQSPPTAESLPAHGHSRSAYHNPPTQEAQGSAHTYTPRLNGRSSGLRQEVTPMKTPTKTPDRNSPFHGSPTPSRLQKGGSSSFTHQFDNNRSAGHPIPTGNDEAGSRTTERTSEIKNMEDSLRKILKLDSGGGSVFSV